MNPTELAELRADVEAIVKWNQSNQAPSNAAYRLARAFLAAPPPLAWTDAKPTVPGFWYWRPGPDDNDPVDWEVLDLNHITNGRLYRVLIGQSLAVPTKGQFAGPIPLPVDLEVKEMG